MMTLSKSVRESFSFLGLVRKMLELNTEHDRALSSAAYYNKILLQVIMSQLSSLSIFLLHFTQAT